jgi:hypothetical protein
MKGPILFPIDIVFIILYYTIQRGEHDSLWNNAFPGIQRRDEHPRFPGAVPESDSEGPYPPVNYN